MLTLQAEGKSSKFNFQSKFASATYSLAFTVSSKTFYFKLSERPNSAMSAFESSYCLLVSTLRVA